ncbi:MAG: RHS repeat-associated core domain-containing protein, partial [Ginsengibacter sp.]
MGNYTAGTLGTPGQTGIPMTKNGYLYVWVSNETQGWDVYFDNLSVAHRTGPLLEENHYYPFGLAMAAISAKALKTNYAENKLRYNGGSELQNREFSDGSGLEMYETSFRGYDVQIGRFAQIDPMAGSYLDYSSYSYCSNNPVLFSDPSGARYQFQKQSSWYHPFNGYERPQAGGGSPSDIGNLTGMGGNSFEDWVNNINVQIDQQVEKSNLISTAQALLAEMPNEFLLQLTNNFDGTFDVTGHAISDAEWATDKDGNTGIRYQYSYGASDGGGEFLHETLNTDYLVSGFIKYNTYGLFDPSRSFDPGANGNSGEGWTDVAGHFSDGIGGFGAGMGKLSGTFRLTDGTYNGSSLSLKYYSSGWNGGSRAGITTYSAAKWGSRIGKGSIIVSVGLGAYSVYDGY